ncbi:MAG: FUSC family protein [Candidatus Dormibacteria bacterium]
MKPSPRWTDRLSALAAGLRASLEGTLLQAAKTAVASGISWLVAADLLGNQIPVFAPLAAVLTVQVTVWQSVSRGLQRVAGVMVGVVVAGAFAQVAGIHAWSIALVIFVSLVVGRALRLGTQGSIQVPISALLVLVLGATLGGYGFDRVLDTAIGAACGILINLIVFPRTHLNEAEARVRGVASGLAALVERVAGHVHPGEPAPAAPDPDDLLDAARQLGPEVTAAGRVVSRAEEACRWNPAGQRGRATAEQLHAAMPVLEMVERQVRGMARAVSEAGPGWSLSPHPSEALARLLVEVAAELRAWDPVDHPVPPEEPQRAGPAEAAAIPAGAPGPAGAASGPGGDRAAGEAPGRDERGGQIEDGLYDAVLGSLRGSGLTPHAAALVTAIAVDARRIREELSWRPSLEIRAPGWRSLFDQGAV